MEKQERLQKAFNYLKNNNLAYTQRDVAEKMKASEQNVCKALRGGELALTNNFLRRFNKAYNNIFSYDWLLFGEGDMLAPMRTDSISVRIENKNSGEPIRALPLIPIDALAGMATEDNEGVSLSACERYNVPEFIDSGAQFLIRVSGDSMIPRYISGDVVAVKRVEDVQFFQWGKIYVLDTNQGALIKRVYQDPKNERNILCHSENTGVYADFTMPKSSVRGLFVIVGVIHTE